MTVKIIGAIITVVGCGSVGIRMAVQHRKQVAALEQLLIALTYMHCELQYRLTPLPSLCRQTAAVTSGCVSEFFRALSRELSMQLSPVVKDCVNAALKKEPLPEYAQKTVCLLGETLGSFDVHGQLQGISSAKENTETALRHCTNNQQARLRSYQTLSLCAGAALAILFI